MKSRWWAMVLLGVVLGPSTARADMGLPGFKFRELWVVIDNLGDYPDHDFYLVAVGWLLPEERESGPDRPAKPPRVTPGETHRPGYPVRFAHKWLLVAVPRQRAGEVDWKMLDADTPGVLHSNRVQLSQPESVIFLSPRDYEVRHFRVGLTGGQLTLTPGAVEQCSNGFGSWIPGLVVTATVTGMGLWIVRLWRRRRPTSQSNV